MRAAKRKDEVTDVGKKSDKTKLQEEKPEKKTIERFTSIMKTEKQGNVNITYQATDKNTTS